MRTVFCRKYQQDLPGLEKVPFPGALGQDVYENISRQAWEDWQKHQTMMINEKHLNMANLDDRRYIMDQMKKYFSGEDYEKPSGYVPPEKN